MLITFISWHAVVPGPGKDCKNIYLDIIQTHDIITNMFYGNKKYN